MKTLFDKSAIHVKSLRNRFIVAPMSRVSAEAHGAPSPEMLDYYTAFAAGGFGAIITEGVYTDHLYSKAYPNQPGLVSSDHAWAWKKITTSVHYHDAIMIAQLMHAGALSQALRHTIAPSALLPLGEKMAAYGGGAGKFPMPSAMTTENIEAVTEGYLQAAVNAFHAGFDGIELHAANGYLLDQFITPDLNRRKDQYGGSVSNRLRLIAEIVTAVQAHCPKDFIIGLRISEGKVNNLHYRWEGGSQEAKAILHGLKQIPLQYLHVAAEHNGWEYECRYADGQSLTGLARSILNVPVIANGKLHDPVIAGHLLETGQADFFAIGKLALSNPDFVNRLKRNQPLHPVDWNRLHDNPSLFPDERYLLQNAASVDVCVS